MIAPLNRRNKAFRLINRPISVIIGYRKEGSPLALTTLHAGHIFCPHHVAPYASTRSHISQRVSHVIIRSLLTEYVEV
jgi:hypothetical protein